MTLFTDIFGQEAAVESITQAYLADRLPHGLIFAGAQGVGKATTARALGGLFLCEKPVGAVPCGTCASCRVFEAGNHPDYHVITKELIRFHDKTGKSKGIELSINVIRPELIEPAGRKPVMGRGKVFVVEQAEVMNPAAQNALLKTLEEPAGRALIILLTDQPGILLQTVRSRCRTVWFAQLDEAKVRSELAKRKIDPAAAAQASRLARGSLGLALKWIQDDVVAPAGELSSQLEQLMAGHPPDDLPGWFRKAADAYAEKQLERDELASKDQATREGLALYLSLAAEFFRRRLTEDVDPVRLESDCVAIDAIAQAEVYLDANVNIPIVFQQLSLTLENASRAG